MKNLQKKSAPQGNIWHSPIILFLMFIVAIVFLYKMIGLVEKVKETSHKKHLVENKVEELKEKEAILNDKIEKLKTEEGVEEEIREKYQLVKSGEKMVIIVDKDSDSDEDYSHKEEKSKFSTFIKNIFK